MVRSRLGGNTMYARLSRSTSTSWSTSPSAAQASRYQWLSGSSLSPVANTTSAPCAASHAAVLDAPPPGASNRGATRQLPPSAGSGSLAKNASQLVVPSTATTGQPIAHAPVASRQGGQRRTRTLLVEQAQRVAVRGDEPLVA